MESIKKLIDLWDRFFFHPLPVDSISLFRIIWCSLILIVAIFDLGNVSDFYGPHSLTSLETVREQFNFTHLNIFHLFNSSYSIVYSIFVIYLTAIIFSILGFYTRPSLIIVLVCMTSFHQRNIWLLSSSELLMRIVTLTLVFSPCGHAYSIDSILGRKYVQFFRLKIWAPWALRLLQIQLSVVYLWTVIQKLKGQTWIDGTALYYATRIESMRNFHIPFLFDWIPFLKLATWGTLLLELCLGILIWNKHFTKKIIILGILFHLFIEFTMIIPFFEWVMILLLPLFLDSRAINAFMGKMIFQLNEKIRLMNLDNTLKEKIIWLFAGTKNE
jgi:hypothetical protein